MRKKVLKIVTLIMVLAFSLTIFVGCGGGNGEENENGNGNTEVPQEPLKIGALFAITGGAASLGIPERDTVLMLEEQINAAGGVNGRDVEIIIYDTESNETSAVLAARKLVEDHEVSVVIGPTTSGVSLALVDYFNEMEIPLISAAAAARIVEPVQDRHWIFKTPQSDYLVFEAIVMYLKQHGLERVGFINEASGFGDSGRAELEKLAPEWGIDVVAWERFNSDDRDMTAQLTSIRRANPDAIIVWSIPPAASVAQQNIYDMGFDIPIIQSHGIGNMSFIENAPEAAEGVIFPAGKLLVADNLPDSDPQKQTLIDYRDAFQNKFGYTPSTFGGHAWDAFYLVIDAFKAGAETPQQIRDHVERVRNFVGISGVFNFSANDHNGLDHSALTWIKIEDGGWIFHQEIEHD